MGLNPRALPRGFSLTLGCWEKGSGHQARPQFNLLGAELPPHDAPSQGNKILPNLIFCFNCSALIYDGLYIFFSADTSLHVFLLSITTLDR